MEHQDVDAVERSSIVEYLLNPYDDDPYDDDNTDIETTRNAETGHGMEGPNEGAERNGVLTQRAVALASDATIDAQEEDPEEPAIRLVRVIAPSNLRRGYALEVTCDGVDTFEVLVPEGGVRQGQEFTAQVPAPVMEVWTDEAQDICCNMNILFDFDFCCQLSIAPGVMLAAAMRKLGLDCIGRYGSPAWVRRASFLVVALAGTLRILLVFVNVLGDLTTDHPLVRAEQLSDLVLGYYFFLLAMRVRQAVRKKYRIRGHFVSDSLCVIFCSCCSLLQIFRHLKRSGNTPRVFSKPTPAQFV